MAGALRVVFGGVAEFGDFTLAEIDPEYDIVGWVSGNFARDVLGSRIVESHSIDDRVIARQTKQSWSRISGLLACSNRPDFNTRETQSTECVVHLAALVEAGREQNWRPKRSPQCFHFESWIGPAPYQATKPRRTVEQA
jgi:hypothetical protein